MHKMSMALVLVFALFGVFTSVAIAQMVEKGWHKTVTLPSGEVILDMRGEWDMLNEGYGPFSFRPSITDILTVTQAGSKFT